MSHKQVIIIGGGMSGVKTALDLYNGGVTDTMILEANAVLGGRLRTITSGDTKANFDLGASWFHDALHNPLFTRSIEKGNVEYYFDDGKYRYFSKDEKYIEPYKFDQVMNEMMTFTSLYYEQNPGAKDLSLKGLCELYVEKYGNLLNESQLKHSADAVRLWAELWHGECWDKLSSKYVFDGDHLGRNVIVKSGYTRVFQNELEDLPVRYQKKNILVNEQVARIDYTSKSSISLTTKSGKVFTCDYLVVTVPQTCLTVTDPSNEAYIQWSPPLPAHISTILPEIFYGSLGKVILEFDECFWPEDEDRFYALSNVDINSDDASISAWDYPCIFVNYQKVANSPSLIALTQNPLSSYIEKLEPATKNAKIWELFKPLLAQISTTKAVPAPRAIHHTTWNEDPLNRGSYSSVKFGTIDPDGITAAFKQGIEGRIRFAGAETVDGGSNGCAHGAWFSGEREARYLLDKLKPKSKL